MARTSLTLGIYTATVGTSSANYITNGVADDIVINKAISDVSAAGGGIVFLKAGTYTINNSISVSSKSKRSLS